MSQFFAHHSFWPGVVLTLIAVGLLVAVEIVAQEAGGIERSRHRRMRSVAVGCSAAAACVIALRFVVLT